MEKLSRQSIEALQKAKEDLLKSIDDYFDSQIFLHDTKALLRFVRNINNFMKKEVEKLRFKRLDIDVQESAVKIRENGKVYTVEIMRNEDGSIWGIYPDKETHETCIFTGDLRNLYILFKKGILKLEDFPRQKLAR